LGQGDCAEIRLNIFGEIALAIEMGADAVDIGKTIHPTLGESIGIPGWNTASLHSPAAAPDRDLVRDLR